MHPLRRLITGIPLVLAPLSTPATPGMAPQAVERLHALQRHPELAGSVVYWGDVYPAAAPPGTPAMFRYARRAQPTATGWSAAHLTYQNDGTLIIEERVDMSAAYAFARMEVSNHQTGQSGSAVLSADGRQLHYTWTSAGTTRTATETVAAPVVAGPNLHGTMLRNWDALRAGQALQVRLAVPSRLESHGFDLRLDREGEGRTVFSATPSNWLVRMAVAPLRVTFDSATRRLLRYDGRVPPMQLNATGRLTDLDARVLYTQQADGYR